MGWYHRQSDTQTTHYLCMTKNVVFFLLFFRIRFSMLTVLVGRVFG